MMQAKYLRFTFERYAPGDLVADAFRELYDPTMNALGAEYAGYISTDIRRSHTQRMEPQWQYVITNPTDDQCFFARAFSLAYDSEYAVRVYAKFSNENEKLVFD